MVYFIQTEVLFSIEKGHIGHFWLFCRKITHFLVYCLQAYIVQWWCTKIDKYQVCDRIELKDYTETERHLLRNKTQNQK